MFKSCKTIVKQNNFALVERNPLKCRDLAKPPPITTTRPLSAIEAPTAITHPLLYPNPVHNQDISLEYELPGASNMLIELLDVQGKHLASLLNADCRSGKNKDVLALPSNLPDGFYLLNIQTAHGNAVVKLVCHPQ